MCSFRRSSLIDPEINLVFTHPFASHWGSHCEPGAQVGHQARGDVRSCLRRVPQGQGGQEQKGMPGLCPPWPALACCGVTPCHLLKACPGLVHRALSMRRSRQGGAHRRQQRKEPLERKAFGGAETGTSGFFSLSAVFHETLHLSAPWFPHFSNGEVISLTKLLDSSPEIVDIEEPGGLQSIGSQRGGHD